MAIRPIYGNSVADLQALVRDLNSELEELRSGNNRGRRAANAAPAVQPDDLVTKAQIDVLVDRIRAVERNPRANRRMVTGTGGGTTPPVGGLPRATHYIDFAYFFGKTRYDEFKSYTTGYWCGSSEDESDPAPPTQEWQRIMADRLIAAANDNKGIIIEWEHAWPEPGDDTAQMLEAVEMAGFDLVWPKINGLIPADEPNVDLGTLEGWLDDIRGQIRAYNLPIPPLGITLTRRQTERGTLLPASVDFFGVECYIDGPGDPAADVNVDEMVQWIRTAKSLIPASKQICLIMQAYNRNGTWTNEDTLLALQVPVYLEAWDDPRVDKILMFDYDRLHFDEPRPNGLWPKGTRDLGTPFINEHKRIFAALTGQTVPTTGCSKLTSGAILQEHWFDGFDLCIIENFGVLFENPGDGTYVIAGQEAAARDALVAVLNRDQYPVEAIAAVPVPPYGDYDVLMRPQDSTEFSELFTPFASNRKCRLAGGYKETCRPSKFGPI